MPASSTSNGKLHFFRCPDLAKRKGHKWGGREEKMVGVIGKGGLRGLGFGDSGGDVEGG